MMKGNIAQLMQQAQKMQDQVYVVRNGSSLRVSDEKCAGFNRM